MITKLTAENAELYYAPRFAEITAAFKAAGQDIEIRSLEDYFLYLDKIAALQAGAKNMPNAYLLVLPADEDIFAIDANSRAISIPAFVKKNGIGVYGDHRAEMIVMTVDRYFDHEDFLNDKIVINWNFTPAGAKIPVYEENQAAAAFAPNEELNPGLITFGFIITKDMTPQKGTLTFSVTIYDDKSDEIVYSFNTLTASVAINDTLTLVDPSIVKNDTDNYVGRLTNSVYTNNTITPVGTPVWKSGKKDGENYLGLDEVAYFKSTEDLEGVYVDGVMLKAYATVEPNTADIVYKWTFAPVDGTIETGREFSTVNLASDYVEVELPRNNPNDGTVYYQKDEMGRIAEAMTYDEAKAIYDAADVSDNRPFLNLKVKKVASVPEGLGGESADVEGKSKSQANQDKLALAVNGDTLRMSSIAALESYASTNESQGSGEWVALDIDTGLESIEGIQWGDSYILNADDVAEAASVGLGAGHIVFWVKADVVAIASRTVTLTAEGYKQTKMIVKYDGVKEDFVGSQNFLVVTNETDMPKFFVRGSSFQALSAGNYQVVAQARIQAGDNYEKVLEGADLKVNTEYFLKDENDEIDKLNPIMNEDAAAAQAAGKELFVCVSAARNSVPVESNVLSVPPAVQPQVTLSVASEFSFGDDVILDPDFEGEEYVYIDSTQLPEIVATVTIDSANNEDKAGAFATELVQTSVAALTLAEIEQKIADHDLIFQALPEDGKFIFTPEEIEEGEYVVRAINRRNGTYSVSENSDSINTSFVAPAITNIDVNAIFEDEDPIPALIGGMRPNNAIQDFEITRTRPSYSFELIDKSTNNFENAQISYFIEEVDYDEETGVVTDRETSGYVEPYGETDIRPVEVIQDAENGNLYRFSITNDPGFYRIRTVNRYNGTIHTAYTDIFGIKTH